jgi:hypothetical protein
MEKEPISPPQRVIIPKTDKELMTDLINSESDSEGVVVPEGEDFVEVDGVKTVPFSVKRDMAEGKFDRADNFIGSSDGSSSSGRVSSESEDSDSVVEAKIASRLRQIVALINPFKTVREALSHCTGENADKLAEITDLATDLLFLGREQIYDEDRETLEEELSHL